MKKVIPSFEIQLEFTRSRGPGGQHVNKTNSAVLLRWYPMASSILTISEKERVQKKWQSKLTTDGAYLLRSEDFREQDKNKKAAIDRLHADLELALKIPKKRIATKPSRGQRLERLKEKKKRSEVKKIRREKISL